jgi:hypothetical protein
VFELLKNESELYMEEQILSCLFYNTPEKFVSLEFDDWYEKEWHDTQTKFFYEIFLTGEEDTIQTTSENIVESVEEQQTERILEKLIIPEKNKNTCVAAISIKNPTNTGKDYSIHAKRMIESYLEHTNFDIVIVTDNPSSFNELDTNRVKIVDYDNHFDECKKISGFFNYHLKRYAISVAKEFEYDVIYYVDCDTYIIGWDDESFKNKCEEDFDIAFVSHASPALGDLRTHYKHFQDKIDLEYEGLYYDELDMAPNPAETHVLIKNNEKLTKFLEFWDKVSKNNKHNNPTYHDGVYFGTSGIYADMKMIGMNHQSKFTEFSRISHGDKTLNFFGHTIS